MSASVFLVDMLGNDAWHAWHASRTRGPGRPNWENSMSCPGSRWALTMRRGLNGAGIPTCHRVFR